MEPSPNIVVGIDLGYTHTGVAYSRVESGRIKEPDNISFWPGRDEVVYKVPTRVAYMTDHKGPTAWGFIRPKRRETVEKYFKLSLDPSLLPSAEQTDPDDEDFNIEDVRKWFTDFLGALRDWINQTLEKEYGVSLASESTSVEYVFSVPTTWNTNVVSDYEKIINNAGYNKAAGHTAKIGLTEAEAAAVYTSIDHAKSGQKKFQQGEVLIACDVGGGTTDVSILKVESLQDDIPQLKQLHCVEGDIAGSVNIDEEFNDLVRKRLKRIENLPSGKVARIADIMSDGFEYFQSVKHNVGKPEVSLLPVISIEVPESELGQSYNHAEAQIANGKMMFTPSEIEGLFDTQVDAILKLIDRQLDYLQADHLGETVQYLVLSGGLGSSAYVYQKIRKHLDLNKIHPNAQNIEITISKEPQLVVCRGLVLSQLHEYFKISVISGLCSRESYGITYDEPWDKSIHQKSTTLRVKHSDGAYYVHGKIHWLIDKNDFFGPTDPPTTELFSHALSFRNPQKMVRHEIVKFAGLRIEDRPDRIDPSLTPRVCTIECDLGPAIAAAPSLPQGVKIRYRHRFGMRTHRFLEAEYRIIVHRGPADLKFELWFAEMRNKGGEVRVNWQTEGMVTLDGSSFDSD